MVKETLSARISQATFKELKEYAEERGMSKSEATDRLVEKGLKVEDKDILIVSTDGGTRIENTLNQAQQTLQNQQTVQKHLNVILLLSIFWLGVHLVFSVPSVVTILTGIVLVGVQSYSYIRHWKH
jgi:hypothetical protein